MTVIPDEVRIHWGGEETMTFSVEQWRTDRRVCLARFARKLDKLFGKPDRVVDTNLRPEREDYV
jgi:hypothetical protein